MIRYNKYGNHKCTLEENGVVLKFDSEAEKARYVALKKLVKAGKISSLERQVRFRLSESYRDKYTGKLVPGTCYVADFVYNDENGEMVVEDVKGFRTDVYKLKKNWMKDKLKIDIKEVQA